MPARTTAPQTGQDREVLRLPAPVALWWVWLVFVAANIADFAVQGVSSPRFGAVISAILLFVTGLMYTLALRPRVVTDSAGITVLNPFRTHRIPWPLIRSVDTGEWVRVHYGLAPVADPEEPSERDSAILHCWALYISAGARRKIRRGPRPRARMPFGPMRVSPQAYGDTRYGASADSSSRLPDEARRLASLPVAGAMASRLDARAARERQRARKTPASHAEAEAAAASWSLPAIAAALIPALILLIVALA